MKKYLNLILTFFLIIVSFQIVIADEEQVEQEIDKFTYTYPYDNFFSDSNRERIWWSVYETSSCQIYVNSQKVADRTCQFWNNCNYRIDLDEIINTWEIICDGVSSGKKDIIKPELILEFPNNNQRLSSNNVELSWRIEPTGFDYICHLNYNWNYYNSYFSQGDFSVLLSGLNNGWHNWRVSCVSPDGLDFSSNRMSFNVDLRKPEVDLISPNSNFLSFANSNTFIWEVNTQTTCRLFVGDILRATRSCSGSSSCSADIELADGNYEWYVSCFDSFGQIGVSDKRFIQVDILPQGYISDSCSHGGTRSSASTTYTITSNTGYGTNNKFDYILPVGSQLSISQISANNFLCSNGAAGLNTPFVVFWKYYYGNFIEYISNGFQFGNNIERSSIIGPSSSRVGYKPGEFYRWSSGGSTSLSKPVSFNQVGEYVIYSDMVNAICDRPGYVCPDLQGSWRSSICRVGTLDTPSKADGWRELKKYNILVFDGGDIEIQFPSIEDGNLNIIEGINNQDNLITLDLINEIPFDLNFKIVELSCFNELEEELVCNLLSPEEVIISSESEYKLLFTLNTQSDEYVGWPNVKIDYIINDNLGIDEFKPKREVKILSPIHFKGNIRVS